MQPSRQRICMQWMLYGHGITRLQGAAALVLCYERVGAHSLIATNVFVREEESWLMVHHQSGPSPLLPDSDDGPDQPVH